MQSTRKNEMEPGDLVVAAASAGSTLVSDVIDPMPSRPGKTRWWVSGEPALIVAVGYREKGNISIKKFKILLDGMLWWVGGNQIDMFGDKDETRRPRAGNRE